MASHMSVSLSESVQASIILQRQERQRQREDERKGLLEESTSKASKEADGHASHDRKALPLCIQFLLSLLFSGIEIVATFSQLYSILFLQFLGVPTSLMTMAGVVCGSTTVILLPVTGWLADKGKDAAIRKLKLMTISFVAFTLGLIGVATCSASKLYTKLTHSNATGNNNNNHNITLIQTSSFHEHQSGTSSDIMPGTVEYTTQSGDLSESGSSEDSYNNLLPFLTPTIVAPAAIISFALLDIGFDSAVSLSRAFIMECSPPVMHTRLLVLATAFASIGGSTFSAFGIFDFPTLLATSFHVDGTAAMMLVFSCSILVYVLCCYAISATTGYLMHTREKRRLESERALAEQLNKVPSEEVKKRIRWKPSRSKMGTVDKGTHSKGTQTSRRIYDNKNDSHVPNSPVESPENDLRPPAYEVSFDKAQHPRILPPKDALDIENYTIYEDRPLDIKPLSYQNDSDDDYDMDADADGDDDEDDKESLVSQAIESRNESIRETSLEDAEAADSDDGETKDVPPMIAAIKASYSMSMSILQSSHSQVVDVLSRRSRKGYERIDSNRTNSKNNNNPNSIFKNRRLMILCLSIFFTMGCLACVSMQGGNTLTIGIYHGDPLAAPETPGRDRYVMGLRAAALGNLVMYLSYTATSFLNQKLLEKFGEKAVYCTVQLLLGVVLVVFVLTKTEHLYYAVMVVAGAYRSSAFTLGYLMANQLVMEKCSNSTKKGNQKPVHNIGQVMVLIGFLLPCHYLLISIIMGPLISYTGSVWVPMIYASGCAFSALGVFSLLVFVKI